MKIWFALVAVAVFSGGVSASFDRLVRKVSRETSVPEWVLKAVCKHESESFHKGKRQAWPWTLNIDKKGYWFKSKYYALDYAKLALKVGSRNIDVGLCQINWRWHGHNFGSIDQMLDPQKNLVYAAEYLLRQKGSGSWEHAIGAYHSPSDKKKAKNYAKVVLRFAE